MYLFIPKLQQVSHGVGAWGEDEDEGGRAVAVSEGLPQVEGWSFDKGTTQSVGNELLYHGNNLEDELEERMNRFLCVSGEENCPPSLN